MMMSHVAPAIILAIVVAFYASFVIFCVAFIFAIKRPLRLRLTIAGFVLVFITVTFMGLTRTAKSTTSIRLPAEVSNEQARAIWDKVSTSRDMRPFDLSFDVEGAPNGERRAVIGIDNARGWIWVWENEALNKVDYTLVGGFQKELVGNPNDAHAGPLRPWHVETAATVGSR